MNKALQSFLSRSGVNWTSTNSCRIVGEEDLYLEFKEKERRDRGENRRC